MWMLALTMTLMVACKEKKVVEDQELPSFYDTKAAEQASRRQAVEHTEVEDFDKAPVAAKEEAAQTASVDWPRKMEVPAPMGGADEKLLTREGYRVSYNARRRIPNWVAWHLTAAHTKGNFRRDDMVFTEDTEVPVPRATDGDYVSSRYDRGHLCPSGDCKWSKVAQAQSFLFTNVCPQNHSLNKGDWNDLEIQCRRWARDLGDIYVVAGPVFYGAEHKTIGRNRVAVPDAFFKVLLADGRKTKAIGFVYPNRGGHKDMTEYVMSVDDVERLTGLDFFPMLDDRVEDQVEAADHPTMVRAWRVDQAVSYANARNNQQ